MDLKVINECFMKTVKSDRYEVISALRQAIRTLHAQAYETERTSYNTKFAEELNAHADVLEDFANEIDD